MGSADRGTEPPTPPHLAKPIPRFLKATLVGGFLFMVPLILLIVVLRHGMELAGKVADPVTSHFPVHHVAGLAVTTVAALVLILMLSFVIGLAVQTSPGRRLREALEWRILGKLPGYVVLKSMLTGSTGLENESEVAVVLARIEDAWQIAFLVETHDDGQQTVFLPGAPSPSSGTVIFLPADRVRRVDVTLHQAVGALRHFGRGSKDLLRGKLS